MTIEWYTPKSRPYPYYIPSPVPLKDVKRITLTTKDGKRFILKTQD